MNRSIQDYLRNANQAANQSWLGADGSFDNFAGNPGTWFDATGGAPAPSAGTTMGLPKSDPYIVQASNASASSVTTTLFEALTYLQNPPSGSSWSNGSLVQNNVTISSLVTNVSYNQLLGQSQVSPFNIGQTLIVAVGGTPTQAQQPLTLTTRDANGMQASKVMTPILDPYQNLSNAIVLQIPFSIDMFTGITFNLAAGQVVQFFFYPADTINIARGLDGRPVSKQFSNPSIIRPAQR